MMQSVVITGVSTGIGRSAAEHLLKLGYRVFGSVRQEATAREMKAHLGESFIPLVFDVTDEPAVAKAKALVEAALAGQTLSALVNNAGIAVAGPLETINTADLRRQLETNLMGPHIVTRAFCPFWERLKAFQAFLGVSSTSHPSPAGFRFPLWGRTR